MNHMKFAVAILAFSYGAAIAQEASEEEAHPKVYSPELEATYKADIKKLQAMKFQDGLVSGSLGAVSKDAYSAALKSIKTQWNTLKNSPGDSNTTYDAIIQAGHYKRITNLTGASGEAVTEQQLVAYIVKGVAEKLRASGKNVLVLSADEYAAGLKGRIFLAIHADGSKPPCKTGPSLSYQTNSSTLAMHAIGWGLSQALGYKFDEFKKDGYTANAAKYYMYSRVHAPVMKGLLEVGDISCPPVEGRLIVSADGISNNVARAIAFVLDAGPAASVEK